MKPMFLRNATENSAPWGNITPRPVKKNPSRASFVSLIPDAPLVNLSEFFFCTIASSISFSKN